MEGKIDTQRGISRSGFLKGGSALLQASEQILARVFTVIDKKNPSFINWTEFLSAMMILKCGNAEERFELFVQMYDDNWDGTFDYHETKRLFLQRILDLNVKHDKTAEEIAHTFAKSVFRAANASLDSHLTKSQLHDVIMGSGDQNLIDIFCDTAN